MHAWMQFWAALFFVLRIFFSSDLIVALFCFQDGWCITTAGRVAEVSAEQFGILSHVYVSGAITSHVNGKWKLQASVSMDDLKWYCNKSFVFKRAIQLFEGVWIEMPQNSFCCTFYKSVLCTPSGWGSRRARLTWLTLSVNSARFVTMTMKAASVTPRCAMWWVHNPVSPTTPSAIR